MPSDSIAQQYQNNNKQQQQTSQISGVHKIPPETHQLSIPTQSIILYYIIYLFICSFSRCETAQHVHLAPNHLALPWPTMLVFSPRRIHVAQSPVSADELPTKPSLRDGHCVHARIRPPKLRSGEIYSHCYYFCLHLTQHGGSRRAQPLPPSSLMSSPPPVLPPSLPHPPLLHLAFTLNLCL